MANQNSITVVITNLSAIRSAFRAAPFLMTRQMNLAIRKTVISIGRKSRKNTPVDTGRLRASTYENFSNLRGEVGTNTNYDYFVHEGTRFTKARPYLARAIEQSRPEIDEFFTDALNTVLHEVGRRT